MCALTCMAANVHSQGPVAGELLTAVRTDLLLLSGVSLLDKIGHKRNI